MSTNDVRLVIAVLWGSAGWVLYVVMARRCQRLRRRATNRPIQVRIVGRVGDISDEIRRAARAERMR